MVNFGFNVITLVGLIDILVAIGYLMLTATLISKIFNSSDSTLNSPSTLNTVLRLFELLVSPIMLLLSGIILTFYGWRLEPILQLQQVLFHVIVGMAFARTISQIVDPRG